MITEKGYSKDPGIPPEAVVITLGKAMMDEQGGMLTFLRSFSRAMEDYEDGGYWMHKCSNLPKIEVDIIYLIVAGRLWAKVYCGGYSYGTDDKVGFTADGKKKVIDFRHILLSGPIEKCPFKRTLKGFQGFRYATKLF